MRTSLPLTPQQAARIENAVRRSGAKSDSEILDEALALLEKDQETRAVELEFLKREYADGKASGEPEEVDRADFLKDLKAERRAHRG